MLEWASQLDPVVVLTLTRGIRILTILVIAWLAFRILKILTARVQRQFEDEDDQDESDTAMEQRAKTMVHLLNSVGAAAIGIAAALTILNLFMPIGPLLAGVGMVGLAISFGAQTLVKDFIAGFFILLENQFAVGDIVEVNGKSGVVERVSLRVVSLRDVEGVLHTIPNGAIDMVSNKTRTWARAVLDIGVAYKERVDEVMRVVTDIAAGIWEDHEWRPKLIKEPMVWGVQDLGDSSVNIRLVAETRPARQWEVRRELLRRIKNRFDQEGIEIPFPQRTVHLRHVGSDDDLTPS
ncbi:MAG: hypothetical protein AMS18_02315 [Gemmatimonas sp. SG8_17]|nr:MAG: hypothetical protein AMS18_02315 [Gemmatimonas sp. SG8_17]